MELEVDREQNYGRPYAPRCGGVGFARGRGDGVSPGSYSALKPVEGGVYVAAGARPEEREDRGEREERGERGERSGTVRVTAPLEVPIFSTPTLPTPPVLPPLGSFGGFAHHPKTSSGRGVGRSGQYPWIGKIGGSRKRWKIGESGGSGGGGFEWLGLGCRSGGSAFLYPSPLIPLFIERGRDGEIGKSGKSGGRLRKAEPRERTVTLTLPALPTLRVFPDALPLLSLGRNTKPPKLPLWDRAG